MEQFSEQLMYDLIVLKDRIYTNLKTHIIIGAMDGIKHDRVFNYLGDRTDYKAVFVEPVDHHFSNLLINVGKLKGEVYCEKAAVTGKHETVEIVSLSPKHYSDYPHFFDGCSSVVENNSPINIFMKGVNPDHRVVETFNTVTFDDLVNKYKMNNIDYLQIDTEGRDHKIIDSIDIIGHNIKVVRFELYYLPHGYYNNFVSIMNEKNYTSIIDHEDVFCVSNEYLKQLGNTL